MAAETDTGWDGYKFHLKSALCVLHTVESTSSRVGTPSWDSHPASLRSWNHGCVHGVTVVGFIESQRLG